MAIDLADELSWRFAINETDFLFCEPFWELDQEFVVIELAKQLPRQLGFRLIGFPIILRSWAKVSYSSYSVIARSGIAPRDKLTLDTDIG
ncbi:hypothetical protein [Natrinema soli]|uniref:Uncharacterized protein n=1 Tax=Natrinema soli TaxID=1930624 RepID=A0ABD5SFY4_9EURY|nr:hypothetical protein [Natrinema soli]